MPSDPEPRTLDLRDYMRVVRRFKWTIALTVVVAVGAALAFAFLEDPIYRTHSKIIVSPRLSEQLLSTNPGTGTDRGLANEIQVMASPSVRKEVAEELGRGPSVSLATVGETDVISIQSKGNDPKLAAETANVYAEVYLKLRQERTLDEFVEASTQVQEQISQLDLRIAQIDGDLAVRPPAIPAEGQQETGPVDPRLSERSRLQSQRTVYAQQLDKLQTSLTVSQEGGAQLLAEAGVPASPINKTPVRNGLAGLGVGLVLGIALAFLREYLDDTVKSKETLERASGLSVVGLIPALPEWKNRKATPLAAQAQPRSAAAEAYRTLRTSVEFLSLEHPIRSMQVTSALAAEGKTTTLSNLATSFANAGQRVIILCCDLRRPRVHEFFGLNNSVGFTSVLLGDTALSDAIQPVPGNLPMGLVASGLLPPNPAELLSSERAANVIEALSERCDLLLIDSPPIVPVTDGLVIAGLVDAVLLVADSGSTTKRGLGRAVELLRQVDAPLVGAVLNGVKSKSEYGYASTDEYYHYRAQGAEAPRTKTNGRRSGRKKARATS